MNIDRHFLLVIGDVHGRIEEYVHATRCAEASIQLGDLGFDYRALAGLDPRRHKIVAGNHDNYRSEVIPGASIEQVKREHPNWRYTFGADGNLLHLSCQTAHFLGDFGVWKVPGVDSRTSDAEIFFCRGERSADKSDRREGKDWFAEEELTESRLEEAIELYRTVCPQFVVSHTAPASLWREIIPGTVSAPSRTSKALQITLDIHRPRYWLFGHFHIGWGKKIRDTLFLCLDELHCANFNRQMELQPPIEDARSWFAWRD